MVPVAGAWLPVPQYSAVQAAANYYHVTKMKRNEK